MATDAMSSAVPKAPFVIVTRKGGFPAITVAEACRLVRPLVTDGKAAVTDAAGHRYTPREFLTAAQAAAEAKERASAEIQVIEPELRDWASKTSDLDLGEVAPVGWLPAPVSKPGMAGRSSGRQHGPHARLSRPTSDRRPVSRGPDGKPRDPLVLILLGAGLVVVALAWLVLRPGGPANPTAASTAPRFVAPVLAPSVPAAAPPIRLEDRPLPTYMR